MRLLLTAAFALVVGQAQTPVDAARVRELLASPQMADNAWGAHYAAELRDPNLHDLLVEHLRKAAALPPDSRQGVYIESLLDALIQTGGAVPLDALMPFKGWHAEFLILLSRQQGREATLLEFRENAISLDWLAVNNLLFGMRSQEFFSRTLKEAPLSHTFTVRDVEHRIPGAGNCGGMASDSGPMPIPPGFPTPMGYYMQTSGGQMLADGPRPIYYQLAAHGVPDVAPVTPQCQKYGLEYLAAWNHLPNVDAIFQPTDTLQWSNAAGLRQAVGKSLDAQVAALKAFLSQARKNGAAPMAGTRLHIGVTLEDQRLDTHLPLPTIASREFVIE